MEIKIFDRWSTKEVKVLDLGLKNYINLKPSVIPRTSGRYTQQFHRAKNPLSVLPIMKKFNRRILREKSLQVLYAYEMNNENLLALQFKMSLTSCLAAIIHDLFVSLPTFERDFDQHYKQIITTRTNLQRRDYGKYERMLVEKRNRGIQKRKE